MWRTPKVLSCVLLALTLAGCDEEEDSGGEAGMCMDFEFEYAGEGEDGLCPRIECCPDDPNGTFSAVKDGMCLSSANCEAVCADPDAAFECL